MDQEKIGKFIAELRKEKKWTQEDLAKELSVDRTLISKWERGLFVPNLDYLLQFQQLFNVSINEILYGERKNLDNNDRIAAIPINIMEEGKRKLRKTFIFTIITISTLILIFFAYYFLSNYNSIKVYKIYGENEQFYVNDGIMITSREKSYIKIGSVGKYTDIGIVKMRLYFKNKSNESNIFIGGEGDTEILLVNRFNYNELFKYSDINDILKGLFLEIITENDHKYILRLTVRKDFANDNIINDQKTIPISNGEKNDFETSIPSYVKEKFLYNKENEEYSRKSNDNKYSIEEKYFPNIGIYLLIRSDVAIEQRFEYDTNDNVVSFYLFQMGTMMNNFSYSLSNQECINGDCDISLISEFKNNYLKYIDK